MQKKQHVLLLLCSCMYAYLKTTTHLLGWVCGTVLDSSGWVSWREKEARIINTLVKRNNTSYTKRAAVAALLASSYTPGTKKLMQYCHTPTLVGVWHHM